MLMTKGTPHTQPGTIPTVGNIPNKKYPGPGLGVGRSSWGSGNRGSTPTQKYPFYRKSIKWLSQCDLKDSMEIQSTEPSHPRETSSLQPAWKSDHKLTARDLLCPENVSRPWIPSVTTQCDPTCSNIAELGAQRNIPESQRPHPSMPSPAHTRIPLHP